MKNPFLTSALSAGLIVFVGCETMYNMMDALNEAHTYNSSAIAGGGSVAGKDYITGLAPCEDARAYFSRASSSQAEKVTVTPGDDKGTGVEWTDDGGIVIPPGVSIEFVNKGYCMDPHLPTPKSGEEMQLVKTSSLLPNKMRGTYKNLMRRAAAGDEEVQNNMQRLVWALRTAGSDDAMATYLTGRQKEILEENASNEYEGIDSFDGLFDKLLDDAKKQLAQMVAEATSIRVGNFTYNAFDLMDPDKGVEKVEAHMDALAAMSKNLSVAKTGFNYGQIENGIYTDIKSGSSDAPASGNGRLAFTARIANSTTQSYTFYPLDYVGQVGSGDSSSAGTFYATSSTSMRQRTTMTVPKRVETRIDAFDNKLPSNANGAAPIFKAQSVTKDVLSQEVDFPKGQLEFEQQKLDEALQEYGKYQEEWQRAQDEFRKLPLVVQNNPRELCAFAIGLDEGVRFFTGIAVSAGLTRAAAMPQWSAVAKVATDKMAAEYMDEKEHGAFDAFRYGNSEFPGNAVSFVAGAMELEGHPAAAKITSGAGMGADIAEKFSKFLSVGEKVDFYYNKKLEIERAQMRADQEMKKIEKKIRDLGQRVEDTKTFMESIGR